VRSNDSSGDRPKVRRGPSDAFLDFSETDWSLLAGAIVAGSRLNKVEWRRSWYRLRDQHEDSVRLQFWSTHLAILWMFQDRGARPSNLALRSIGWRIERRYRQLVPPSDPSASTVLLDTFGRLPFEDRGDLFVQRIAVLSQLLPDAAGDLERLKPDVRRVWEEQGPALEASLREMLAELAPDGPVAAEPFPDLGEGS